MQNLDRFKFRWFEKSTQQMYDVQMLDVKNDYAQVLGHFADEYTPVDEVKISDGVLMQCTGLKDKNNKLIFEGDIAKCDCDLTQIYKVVFYKNAFHLETSYRGNYGEGEILPQIEQGHFNWENFCKTDYSPYIVEIIGNIHQNPELLKNN